MGDVTRALERAGQELAVVWRDDMQFGAMARATVLAFLKEMPATHWKGNLSYQWTVAELAAAIDKERT